MYLRTVLRSTPTRSAIAVTVRPCRYRSKITTTSPSLTTTAVPRTVGAMLIQCRAPTPKLSARSEPHARVGKFQSPVLGRMRPAITSRGARGAEPFAHRRQKCRRQQTVAPDRSARLSSAAVPDDKRYALCEDGEQRTRACAKVTPEPVVVHRLADF